jgi:hypothetical protein
VNPDGSVRKEDIVTTFFSAPATPKVAVNAGGSIAVLYKRLGTYSFRVFDTTGVGSNAQPVMSPRDLRVASNGTTFTIVGNTPAIGPTEIDWATFDEHGTIIVAATKLFASRGMEIAPVSLSWNADRAEWALAYLDSRFPFSQVAGDYRLRRFTAAGTLISDSTFSPDPIQTRLATTLPFAWTGSSYITAASRSASGTLAPESYVIRNCPLTANVGASLQYIRPGDSVIFTANVDGGAGDRTYSWDLGDGSQETAKTFSHRFNALGDYTVVLRVTDSTGAISVSTFVIHVVTPRRRASRR